MTAIRIAAPSDVNGNPQRGWIIVNSAGVAIEFVDEGYQGTAAPFPGSCPTISVTQAEYRRWRRGVNLGCA